MDSDIALPDRLNIASWFLDQRLDEGLAGKTAIYYHGSGVADPACEVSYAELVESSCRVANLLRELGLEIEDRVLMILPDTPLFVATYFGAARAGCVTVPISNWLTTEDYAYYLEYVRPTAVICDAECWPALAAARSSAGSRTKHYLVHDRNAAPAPMGTIDIVAGCARQATTARTEPTYRDDFATWLTSSGSTGKPKCSVHMHHDIVWGTIAYAQRTLGIRRDDITLSSSKLFFAYGTISNLLYPLSVGASCVLIPHLPQPGEYFELLECHRASLFATIPTNVAKMLAAAEREPALAEHDLSTLGRLTTAGEALPLRVHRAWRERFGIEIYDAIGSTEMIHPYIANRLGDVKEGSLGRIVEGYEYELLDDAGHPVGVGAIGNLVVRGPTAAQGYWRMRDKSRATFHGDRVMGGDKFMVDADGYFWYRGRSDDLFKSSGMFVAPVEIEDVLVTHPSVREVAVVGFTDAEGLEKVMAFIVLTPNTELTPALDYDLIGHCCTQLPTFKVPRKFEFVTELPYTATGKLHRTQLRERARDQTAAALVLREAASVLALADPTTLDPDQAFTALGLDSLTAVALRNALEQRTGLVLDTTLVMRNPSLRELVDALLRAQREPSTRVAEVARVARDQPLPLSFSQRRLWRLAARSGWTATYNTVMAFELVGALDHEAFVLALGDVVERHETLRTAIVTLDGVPHQQILARESVDLRREDLAALDPATQAARIDEHVESEYRSVFAEHGARSRFSLFTSSPTRHALIVTMDHIICDLWSNEVLMTDLGHAYRSRVAGSPPSFVALPFQYVDFAVWERARFSGPRLDELSSHWRAKLGGAAQLELPTDHPRPEILGDRGATLRLPLTAAHRDAIVALAEAHGVTTFVVLLALWQLLLCHYSGQHDVVVGTLVANRTRREIEPMIGPFFNFVALRTDLSGDPSFAELLGRASTVALDAFEHQSDPMDLVIDALGLAPTPNRRPLFQTVVALQDAAQLVGSLGEDLSYAPLPIVQAQVSRFELMLACTPTRAGLQGSLRYSTELYEAATIARIAEQLCRLLDVVSRSPGSAISKLLASV